MSARSPALVVLLLALGAAACDASGESGRRSGRRPPNVLVLLSDQHNAGALGSAGAAVTTPALDRLAREGVRFTDAFCNTPQCAPSRYTIWTGRYARSHGLRANRVPERLDERTIGEVLREAGFATASIGKHHMTRSPREHGFDTVVDLDDFEAFREAGDLPHWNRTGWWVDYANDAMHGHVGKSGASNEEHRDGWFTTRALEFLREPRDRPFCLWLSFYGPHTPIMVSSPWADGVAPDEMVLAPNVASSGDPEHRVLLEAREKFAELDEKRQREVMAFYLAFVEQVDHNVGRVLDELDRLGLADETVVVYLSDHGDMQSSFGLWGKFLFHYEAAVRVPLLVRAPGAEATAGRTSDALIELVDLAPTLLDLAGVPVPDALQGRSFAPLLEGRPYAARDVVIAEAGFPGLGLGASAMARSRTHKYVWNENGGDELEQLFDLEADPWETTNVAALPEHADLLAELRAALDAWEAATPPAPLVPPEER